MTSQARTASQETWALGVAGEWLKSRRHQALAALVLYAAGAIGFLGLHVLPHLGS